MDTKSDDLGDLDARYVSVFSQIACTGVDIFEFAMDFSHLHQDLRLARSGLDLLLTSPRAALDSERLREIHFCLESHAPSHLIMVCCALERLAAAMRGNQPVVEFIPERSTLVDAYDVALTELGLLVGVDVEHFAMEFGSLHMALADAERALDGVLACDGLLLDYGAIERLRQNLVYNVPPDWIRVAGALARVLEARNATQPAQD